MIWWVSHSGVRLLFFLLCGSVTMLTPSRPHGVSALSGFLIHVGVGQFSRAFRFSWSWLIDCVERGFLVVHGTAVAPPSWACSLCGVAKLMSKSQKRLNTHHWSRTLKVGDHVNTSFKGRKGTSIMPPNSGTPPWLNRFDAR